MAETGLVMDGRCDFNMPPEVPSYGHRLSPQRGHTIRGI